MQNNFHINSLPVCFEFIVFDCIPYGVTIDALDVPCAAVIAAGGAPHVPVRKNIIGAFFIVWCNVAGESFSRELGKASSVLLACSALVSFSTPDERCEPGLCSCIVHWIYRAVGAVGSKLAGEIDIQLDVSSWEFYALQILVAVAVLNTPQLIVTYLPVLWQSIVYSLAAAVICLLLAYYIFGSGAIASDWYLNQTKSAFRKNDTFLYAAEHGGIPNALFISEGGVSSLVLNDNDTIYVFDGNSASATNVTADTAEGAFTYIGYVKNIFPSLEVSSVFNIDRLFWRSNSDNTYYLLYTKQGIVHLRVEGEEAEKYIRASKNNVSNVTVSSITTPSEVVINATFADNVYSFEYGGVAYKINSVLHTISPSITQILA